MSSSSALRSNGLLLAGATLLLVSLSLKVMVGTLAPARSDAPNVDVAIGRFLTQQQLTILPEEGDSGASVHASAGDCSLIVSEIRQQGWNVSDFEQQTAGAEEVFYVFGGRTYADLPTTRTAFDYLWNWLLRRLGLTPPWRPVLGIAAARACHAQRLPWAELAEIAGQP